MIEQSGGIQNQGRDPSKLENQEGSKDKSSLEKPGPHSLIIPETPRLSGKNFFTSSADATTGENSQDPKHRKKSSGSQEQKGHESDTLLTQDQPQAFNVEEPGKNHNPSKLRCCIVS